MRSINATVVFGLAALPEVTDVSLNENPTIIKGKADNSLFPTSVDTVGLDPMVTVGFEDPYAAAALAIGDEGDLEVRFYATANVGGTGGAGDLIFTMVNSRVTDRTINARHAGYANSQAIFNGISADGLTSPLAFSIAGA